MIVHSGPVEAQRAVREQVQPGKLADLLLVDGEPLQDVSHLKEPQRIHLVMQGGRIVHRAPGLTIGG